MKEVRCVVVGGGHVGLHAAKELGKSAKELGRTIRVTLIDKEPNHIRKVLLFRPAVGRERIDLPWSSLLPKHIQFVHGTVTAIGSGEKHVQYLDSSGNEHHLDYDILVLTAGSVVKRPNQDLGGIALTDINSGIAIREKWRTNISKAAVEFNPQERMRLLTAAVAGAGISGIETAAELGLAMRSEAAEHGLDPNQVRIYLLNANHRLFMEGPDKVGRKLQSLLTDYGVTVFHKHVALREKGGELSLQDGRSLPVGLCIWTLGLEPNPILRSLGVPLTADGRVQVDECYRIGGEAGLYSIGDCARIVDPVTGHEDPMTCKEGIVQARRLRKIVIADIEGRPAPAHKELLNFFCIGMGAERGLLWTRKWGVDFLITGKLAWRIKNYGWDAASLLR
ncbi:NAD(P)/FAD-dependent oxidoreductase [Paenibacillus sp. XY044]|uniref:NAD(P)/FAD-dependent oxidoreductase n=1 Tax=Paenibacillus sp. XY044 TaxID=2026089 RepID=UPI000B98CE3B|nr:FAD-dependent oxidoreductase [Paenibacillus sp. XY044]OZB92731.1 pyridine nucleotide-disulfide oxidoreductase [Paenibacillus sp. XY044]